MKGLIHSNIMVILNNSSLKRTIVCRLLRVEYFLPDDRLGRLPGFATFGTFTGFTTGYQVHAEYTVYTVWHVYDCLPGLHRLPRLRLVTGFTTGYQVYTDYTVYIVWHIYNVYDWLLQRLLNCSIWAKLSGIRMGVYSVSVSSNCQRDIGTFAMS